MSHEIIPAEPRPNETEREALERRLAQHLSNIGDRYGFFDKDGNYHVMPGYNVRLVGF
jgi:hypothetical protein